MNSSTYIVDILIKTVHYEFIFLHMSYNPYVDVFKQILGIHISQLAQTLLYQLFFWLWKDMLTNGSTEHRKDSNTAQKMKFSIKGFFSKCDQTHRKLRIWSHLLKKSLMENFIFCGVKY